MLRKLMARLFGKPLVREEVRIIMRDPCRLRLREWRATPELVQRARSYLADPNFRIMLDVLDMENPAGLADFRPISLEQRAIQQARCEGYRMAISNLESMAQPLEEAETLVSTFEPEEPEDHNQ